VGRTGKDLRYWGQGTWAGGSPCGWPECKQVHPIQDVGFLGGYFTDDHINIMHDNFFHLMARETQVLLDLWAEEQADVVLHLHGGSNAMGELPQPYYVSVEINEAILSSARRCYDACVKEGLAFNLIPPPAPAAGANPPPLIWHALCIMFAAPSALYLKATNASLMSPACIIPTPRSSALT